MRKMVLTLLITAGIAGYLPAQQPSAYSRKLSPVLQHNHQFSNNEKDQVFWISTSNNDSVKSLFRNKKIQVSIYNEYASTNLLVIKTNRRIIDSLLITNPLILFIDIPRKPIEELALPAFDNSINTISVVHTRFPAINGSSLVVSVKENKPDTTDIDLKGRFLSTNLQSPDLTSHATIMATIIAGAGNSFYTGKGAAWGSTISSSGFATLLPDPDAAYKQFNITVQNHSYGTGIENYYGADAAAYDATVISNPTLLHVFSTGNSGDKTGTLGTYAGVINMANITGSFKMAKNILTVAATDSFNVVASLSSKGPGYDGRIKPDLVAFGQDGSSGAAAITSGTALLLQQMYKDLHSGQLPPAALVKAVLINSADDLGTKGPDYESGYGNVNAYKAVQTILSGHYFSNSIAQGGTQSSDIMIPANISQLKITLCWSDPAALPNASRALINDLDIELENNSTHEIWQPWVLNSLPVKDSLLLPAVRKKDSLNNTEQISIDNPAAGTYTIRVKGYSIPNGPQQYFITTMLDTAAAFQWYYPASPDNLESNKNNLIRWSSTFGTATGKIEYSINKGADWLPVGDVVDLSKKYFSWHTPATIASALLRMTINAQTFISDTFTISTPLQTGVGFHCSDSVLLYWNKVAGISSYNVYHTGEKYLEPFATVNDTSILIHQPVNASPYYTIAPVIGVNRPGVKAHAFDFTMQGVGCYIKNFLADLINDHTAHLTLGLGTLYRVTSIMVEKLSGNEFFPVGPINLDAALSYTFDHNSLEKGGNVYRIRITLSDGSVIYSNPETVFYFSNDDYLIFPNPVSRNSSLNILSKNPQQATLNIYNSMGQRLMSAPLNDVSQSVPVQSLSKGIYIIVIVKAGKSRVISKLVVY